MTQTDAHYSRYYSRTRAGITPVDPKTVRKPATAVKRVAYTTPLKAEFQGLEQIATLFKDSHESSVRNQTTRKNNP